MKSPGQVQKLTGDGVYIPAYRGDDADPVRDLHGHNIFDPAFSEDGPPPGSGGSTGSFTGHSMGSKGGEHFRQLVGSHDSLHVELE